MCGAENVGCHHQEERNSKEAAPTFPSPPHGTPPPLTQRLRGPGHMGLHIRQQLGQLSGQVGALLLYVENPRVSGLALQYVQHVAQGQAALSRHHKAVPSHGIRVAIWGHCHTHLCGAHGGPGGMDIQPSPGGPRAPPTPSPGQPPPEVGEGPLPEGWPVLQGVSDDAGPVGADPVPVEVEGTGGPIQVGNSKRHAEL